jgi:hypothetical protein
MAYQRNLRIKSINNGWIISTAPYTETFCSNINQVIDFVRNYFTKDNYDRPKRFYGDKKEEE